MPGRKRLQKFTGCVFLFLIICTALARQFQMLLLPQVMTVVPKPGTVLHKDVYPAIAQGWKVSWMVDREGYEYYADSSRAVLRFTGADGGIRSERFKIKDKQENGDGTWTFLLNAKKLAQKGENGLFGALSVCMENEISYEYTLPLSALSMGKDGYMVFAVKTRQGLFSDEQTVVCVPQRVLDQDQDTAAVSAGWTERIVAYTSRPLAEGMRVVIAK